MYATALAKPGWRIGVAAGLLALLAAGVLLLRYGERAGSGAGPATAPQESALATRRPEVYRPSQDAPAEPPPPVIDIFASRTWPPPPPPVLAAAPPPPPQAPPLPFVYIGRFLEPGRAPVFLLAEGQRVLVVRVGDRIGDSYRVEKLEKGQLVFRYRPMNARQTLPIDTLGNLS